MDATGHQARFPSRALIACIAVCGCFTATASGQQGTVPVVPQDAGAPAQTTPPSPAARRHSAFGEAMRNLTQALREAGTPAPGARRMDTQGQPASAMPASAAPASASPTSDPAAAPAEGTALAVGGTP